MVEAWLLPSPGRKEQIGAEISDARIGILKLFLFSVITFFNSCISWGGIFCFSEIDKISEEDPNNPVRSGRRGSLRDKFKERTEIPKIPASKVMKPVLSSLFFSKNNIKKRIIIKIRGIILFKIL